MHAGQGEGVHMTEGTLCFVVDGSCDDQVAVNKNIEQHSRWMTRNFSATAGAITLRLYNLLALGNTPYWVMVSGTRTISESPFCCVTCELPPPFRH